MAAPRSIDEYVTRQEGLEQEPVLRAVLEIIRDGLPMAHEGIKWGSPSFEHKGMLLSLVAFKRHVAVWFHKGSLMSGPDFALQASSDKTKHMRKYEFRSLEDIDKDLLRDLLLQAWELNEKEVALPVSQPAPLIESPELLEMLKSDPKLVAGFRSLSVSKQKEFHEYILSAKRDETRESRIVKIRELIAAGRGLHDRYRN